MKYPNIILYSLALFLHVGLCHAADSSELVKSDVDNNLEDIDGLNGISNIDIDKEIEEEDLEDERNLRCAQVFNHNIYKVLKYALLDNLTLEREGRQEENVDPEELVQSMLDLEVSQILGPVLKIFGSAVANNATAIDENYNKLPYAVRYQVTDLIKFTVDLLTTT